MAASRRLSVKLHREVAMRVSRAGINAEKLVYAMRADKRVNSSEGKSRIVYIGTTEDGIYRLAASAAGRAHKILERRGVKEFTVRVVTCTPRQRVKTWKQLERALLLEFRELYGEVPVLNVQGKGIQEIDEFRYFSRARIHQIIEELR